VIVYALSTGNKIGLGLIALAWIVFSLLAAMVIPRYRKNFPANVGGFLSVCAVFFAATLFAVFYFGKESHESEAAGQETTAQTQTQTQTTETQTGATTGATTTETQAGGATDLAAGKAVFEKAACGGCHVLADAGSKGAVGPDLDQLKPDEATVEHQVINGGGAMPAFKGVLTDTEIKNVATYVSQVAGKT
jgi:mono/diheme cytochrome c family protein